MAVPLPSISDLVSLLDRWEPWKRVVKAPDRIDALEARIADLEERLRSITAGAPADPCPFCGARSWRLSQTRPHPNHALGSLGVFMDTKTCGACGQSRDEVRK